MIHIVVTEQNSRVTRNMQSYFRDRLEIVYYEEIFYHREAPVGHYIFTDFDRLTHYSIAYAAKVAQAIQAAAPAAAILNHPLRVKERVPLLAALHAAGINDFQATRIDTGARPARFPVFIRAEDGAFGTETELLHGPDELERAIDGLADRGIPLKGRIAVEYNAQPDADGIYRKYGAFRLGGSIIPQHLLYSDSWIVKGMSKIPGIHEKIVDEELDLVKSNPHAEALMQVFELGGIDYGRVDYGFVDGRLQVYEINTNPWFPSVDRRGDDRSARRPIIRERMEAALGKLDTPVAPTGTVRVTPPKPRFHARQIPRSELRLRAALRRLWATIKNRRLRRGRP